MFLDAVLDERYEVLFNDIPAITRKWLRDHPAPSDLIVVDGRTLKQKTVREYLDGE